jgi:ubiquinone/menaquinone biosynthesis C-methylase UbiE
MTEEPKAMVHNEEYVAARVNRMRVADLDRRPNKWLSSFPGAETRRRVLDIACGMGYDSFAWAKAGKTVVGIDYNLGLLKQASRLATEAGLKVSFVVADATALPFKDGSFDISYSENLLEHVPAWQRVLDETKRVMAENAIFFVRTTNRQCPRNPEINHLHLYPWAPEFIKRPILQWIMKHRPALVNYTAFPAVNWFTHHGLAKHMRRRGFQTYEIFDLVQRGNIRSRRRARVLELLKKYTALRYFVYPLLKSVQIVAVKDSGSNSLSQTTHRELLDPDPPAGGLCPGRRII